MDDLKVTIHTFSPEDIKEFSLFIQRNKKRKDRKDFELFKLLQQKQPLKKDQLISRLYPGEANPSAYYALRKRLMQHVTDFIVLKQMDEDPTAGSTIMGLLSLARYLFEVGVDRLAWNTLRKAERLAADNEHSGLLNTIYNLQIERADSEFASNLDEIISRRNLNKAAAEEEERANIASSLIYRQLNQSRGQGRNLQFDAVVQGVLQEYGLTQAVSQRPSLFYKLMSITRTAVLAKRDFFSFEPFIIEHYQRMETQAGFSLAHQYYKIQLLYMIAHVLYRNRKFSQSNVYLAQLETALQGQAKNYFTVFYPKYLFLKTANDAFLNNLPPSIKLLEDLLQSTKITLPPKEFLTARMGLSFLYFAQAAFTKANHCLLQINRSDKWCERVMGREWVLKKKMGELIIQVELGNLDLALDWMKSLERSFQDLLEQEVYKNARSFLQLISFLILQPNAATRKDFFLQVEANLDFGPAEHEDLQAMSFYAWLKSKMLGRPYYEVLLELAHAT